MTTSILIFFLLYDIIHTQIDIYHVLCKTQNKNFLFLSYFSFYSDTVPLSFKKYLPTKTKNMHKAYPIRAHLPLSEIVHFLPEIRSPDEQV